MKTGDHQVGGGQAAMAQLLKLDAPPTAVVASNDLTAIGVIGAIHAAGLSVPGDISVVGFDDIELSSFLYPPLSTVRVPRAEIASRAFAALYSASHKQVDHGIEYRIMTELVVRQSTGPANDDPR
jgi:LacI family transcriptional regulator